MTAIAKTSHPGVTTPAAADLACALRDSGWVLTGAAVRTIYTACLTDASGLTVAVSCEAGEVRLEFESEYRAVGDLRRLAWYAQATCHMPAETLAAVASANAVSFGGGDLDVGELLVDAGWSRPYPQDLHWVRPDEGCEVVCIDEELQLTDLPWRIRHMTGRPVTVSACQDTPPQVIAAFALTAAF